jgi:hypothetical protein
VAEAETEEAEVAKEAVDLLTEEETSVETEILRDK